MITTKNYIFLIFIAVMQISHVFHDLLFDSGL